MTEEFGPPIAVNGKRPEWLGDDERCLPCWDAKAWYPMRGGARVRSVSGWASVSAIRVRADHPYYQSAEYKASVGEPEGCGIKLSHSPVEGVREIYVDGLRVTVAPEFDPRPAMTEAEMIAALEATGHTVTPPDDQGMTVINTLEGGQTKTTIVAENFSVEVPPSWALDKAANMAGWDCWDAVHRDNDFLRDSIIAHAETITKHVTPPDPLAGDREFIAGMWLSADWDASAEAYRAGHLDDYVRKIMAYLRANKGRL